jgi:site-specific DNA recombinase
MYYYRGEAIEPPQRNGEQRYRKNIKTARRVRPQEEWIPIPVPPILDRSTWERAQEQLQQNFLRSPRNNKRHSYLLRGLVKCGNCGFTYVGAFSRGRRYYHCGNRVPLPGQKSHCPALSVWADSLEEVVWEAVTQALQHPDILAQEYQQYLAQISSSDALETEHKQLLLAQRRLKSQEDHLIDAYKNEVIELPQLKEEMGKLKGRRQELERQHEALERRSKKQASLREGLAQLKAFCERANQGLEHLDFGERQKLLRMVVDRIDLEGQKVKIQAAIPMNSPDDFVGLRSRSRHPGV